MKLVTEPLTPASPFKVLLVDDHRIVREGIAAILANFPAEFRVCGQASTSKEAANLARDLLPDLIITDYFLGDGDDGTRLISELASLCPASRILVLSLSTEATLAERTLRAGAVGYLVKSEGTDKLLIACRTVLSGSRYVSSEFLSHLLETFLSPTTRNPETSGDLTEREIQIFQLLGSNQSLPEIARRLGLSSKTVASHRENIKRKLGLNSADAVLKAAKQWLQQTFS